MASHRGIRPPTLLLCAAAHRCGGSVVRLNEHRCPAPEMLGRSPSIRLRRDSDRSCVVPRLLLMANATAGYNDDTRHPEVARTTVHRKSLQIRATLDADRVLTPCRSCAPKISPLSRPELPRVLQIEVGTLLAHLCDEQVRGGLGDGVDAGDVGW